MFDLSDLNTSQKKKEIDKENPCWNVQYIQARSASNRNVDTARYEIHKVWHFQQVVLWSDFRKNDRRKKTHQKWNKVSSNTFKAPCTHICSLQPLKESLCSLCRQLCSEGFSLLLVGMELQSKFEILC